MDRICAQIDRTAQPASFANESSQSKLAECTHGVSLDGKDRGTVRQDRELVVVRLLAEDLPARQRRDAGLDARLLEKLGRLERDRDLGTGRDEGDGGVLGLADDVATLRGLLDRRVLELVQVLAGEAAGRVGSGRVGGSLVSVCVRVN